MPKKFRDGKSTTYLMRFIYYLGQIKKIDLRLIARECDTEDELFAKRLIYQQSKRRLEMDGYIEETLLKSGRKNYRLLGAGKVKNDALFDEEQYKTMNANFYGSGKATPKQLRAMKISTTSLYADNAGCLVLPEEKIPLCSSEKITKPNFYLPYEIKTSRDEEVPGFASRATGYILTPSDTYSIYLCGSRDKETNRTAEFKAKAYAAGVFNETREEHSGQIVIEKAIVLCEDTGTVDWLVNGANKKLEKCNVILDSFKNTYAFPLNLHGEHMMEMFLNDRAALEEAVNMPKKTAGNVDCDYYNDGTYYLNFMLPDVNRLERFLLSASLQDARYRIICFEEQEKLLGFIDKGNVELMKFPLIDLWTRYKEEHGLLEKEE